MGVWGITARIAAWLLCLATAWGAWAVPAAAQNARVGVPVSTCVARVLPHDTAATMLASPARFDCDAEQRTLGAGDFWVAARGLPPQAGLASPEQRSDR